MRAILTYHSIDTSRSPISTHPDVFAQHVEWLASGHVQVTTVDDLASAAPERDAVAVTFDDAFENFATRAFPLLSQYRLPVTLFVVSEHAGRDNRWRGSGDRGIPILPLLGWQALKELARDGITLGGHSQTHPDLTRLDMAALEREILGSADRIEAETGVRPRVFAYPYGRVNARVADVVSRRFAWGCTTEFRTLDGTVAPARLPRLDAYYFRTAGRLHHWGTSEFDRYVRARRVLRQVRAAVTAARSAV